MIDAGKMIYRDTKQRAAIKRVFEETQRPLSPKEIQSEASAYVPRLGIATVYRNIKAMVEQGDLVTVDIPGQSPRYHPPFDRKRPLFVCTETNEVHFLEVDLGNINEQVPPTYRVQDFQVFFYGTPGKNLPKAS
jgi:Fur family ferric uptake transcriptional regulator